MIDLINQKICLKGYCLADPSFVYWIVPLLFMLLLFGWISFVSFKKEEEKKAFVKGHRFDRIVFVILRTLIFFSLLVAIASPYKIKETMVEGNPSLTILADNSSSFEVFDTAVAARLKEDLEKYFPVDLKYIASGERSAIGDGILQNAEGDDHILVVSDGYNNYGRDLGDIVLFSSILNTTIHTLKMSPLKKDVSMVVTGPTQVIEQSENTFRVEVNNVGGVDYSNVEAFVDGNQMSLDSEGRFKWRFSLGYHKIMARVLFPKEDHFEQNNIFHKSVKSLPRPKLLFVSESGGPLQEALERIYDVARQDSLPDGLDNYDAVILNDVGADTISDSQVDLLNDYLSEKGNGLIVIGGENSFDKGSYKNSYLESLLPVKIGVGERSNESDVNVVILIDISESTGASYGSGETRLKVEKALALNVLDQVHVDHNLGVIAFSDRSYLVSPLNRFGMQTDVTDKISRLASGSGTNMLAGLLRAEQEFRRKKGSKNIILISDGWTVWPDDVLSKVRTLSKQGVKIYTIGSARESTNKIMKDIASISGGFYYEPEDIGKLKLLFGDAPEDKCEQETMDLFIADGEHWITKGDYTLGAKVSGYNFVVPKSGGRKLLTTDCDRSILVVSRYGLGRIAVLSTDDGSKWSGELLSEKNSKVITRMVNWAIGDFTKDAEFDVRIKDTTLGKTTDVNVISDEEPEEKGFEFAKVDAGLYTAKFRPEEEGFHQILDATVAVSYNDEYEKIGMNPRLEELVTISGGRVFDPSDVAGIKDTIISMSKRVKVDTINYRWPFIIAVILLFLIDVFIRRLRENANLQF